MTVLITAKVPDSQQGTLPPSGLSDPKYPELPGGRSGQKGRARQC